MVDIAILDERLAAGFVSKTRFSTSIIDVSNGLERRNQNWSHPRREYDFRTNNMLVADTQAIVAFFVGRRGRFRSWLLKDWGDYRLTDELQSNGDGVTTATQITKAYDTVNPYTRNITYLKTGTLIVKVDGTATSAYSVDTTTGIITFDVAPAMYAVIRVSCDFYVPVRFGEDVIEHDVDGPEGKFGIITGMTAIEERA